jgi:hypothetical protein
MIKTITELSKNIWEPVTSINSIKSQSPSTGDVYHDINKSKTYVFDGSNWKELKISGKNALNNEKRKKKIKRLFE